MGYLGLLDLVLSEEFAVRDDRRFRNGLRLSKLPHHKTLEDYVFFFQPDLDPRKIKDLATLSFVEDKANVALLGPPGVGKTHIAVALAAAGRPQLPDRLTRSGSTRRKSNQSPKTWPHSPKVCR